MWGTLGKYVQNLISSLSSSSSPAGSASSTGSPTASAWTGGGGNWRSSTWPGHNSSATTSDESLSRPRGARGRASVHADANFKQSDDYSDWEASEVRWCDGSIYKRTEILGRGKYSNVYGCMRTTDGRAYAVKSLKPNRSKKVKREIQILRNLRAGPNIIEYYGAFIDAFTNEPALIFRKIDNVDWKQLYPTMSSAEIQGYAFQLFRALNFAHSRGIMHRDVKPQNILYDQSTRELRLIDWGLAEFYFPGVEYNTHVASRYYKPPEILLGYRLYDYSFDMWSAGCVVAGMILRIEVMFRGLDDEDQLRAIASVLGGAELRAYARKYRINLTPEVIAVLRENRTTRGEFSCFLDPAASTTLQRSAALDLITRLLCYDHAERITAREALLHPYFTGLNLDPNFHLATSAET